MNKQWCDVRLPAELCSAAEQRFGKQFQSLEEFLEFVLTELVAIDSAVLDESEYRTVEERLRELGYI